MGVLGIGFDLVTVMDHLYQINGVAGVVIQGTTTFGPGGAPRPALGSQDNGSVGLRPDMVNRSQCSGDRKSVV